jgi:hypothetical protein
MYAYDKDQQDWYPAGYWGWNLRGQIAANMSSGEFNLNVPIFDMYLDDLPAIESWTSAQMGGFSVREGGLRTSRRPPGSAPRRRCVPNP